MDHSAVRQRGALQRLPTADARAAALAAVPQPGAAAAPGAGRRAGGQRGGLGGRSEGLGVARAGPRGGAAERGEGQRPGGSGGWRRGAHGGDAHPHAAREPNKLRQGSGFNRFGWF